MIVSSCSSDGGASTDASATATTSAPTTAPITEADCARIADEAVVPLEAFVAEYDQLTVEEWNALDPPPDLDGAQQEAIAIAQDAVDRGCFAPTMEDHLADAIDRLEGEGEVGKAIAAALRGDGPLLGPPEPVISTTIARNDVPTTVTLEPGESLARLLERLAPSSTVRFVEGTYRFTEPVIVDVDVTFEGAGEGRTILSSSAEGVAVAFVGPGAFSMRDLTLEHVGDAEASVLLAIEGPVTIEDATITGGVAGDDQAGGGHGVVFAFEDLPGFPEREDDERAGPLRLERTTISGNDAAGVLSTGSAAPELVDMTIIGNGGCGLCYAGTSSGSVVSTVVEANDIGLQVNDDAHPELRDVRISGSATAGASLDGNGAPSISESTIEENGRIGLQVSGEGSPVIERNRIRAHDVGVLVAGGADVALSDNDVVDHEIGVQASGRSQVDMTANTVSGTTVAAVSYSEQATGTAAGNRIERADEVGIQVIERAAVAITDTVISGPGSVGISFVDDAIGSVGVNEISERDVGIQIGGRSTPSVRANVISGSGTAGILFGDEAGGTATGNEVTGGESVGILVSGTASPLVARNDLLRNEVGIAFSESATPTVRANVVDAQTIGVQIVDRAAPDLEDNRITNSTDVGVVYAGTSRGTFVRNVLSSNGDIGLQVGETARPTMNANEIRGDGVYGVLFRGDGSGEFRGNLVVDFLVGVQLDENADPQLYDNTFEDVTLADMVYADESGGENSGNTCAASSAVDISVTGSADPNIGDNECAVRRG